GRLDVVAFGDQLILRKLQRIRFGDQRQQSPLMHQVVHDQHLFAVVGCAELLALQRISGGDVQCYASGGGRAATDGDAAADQRVEHGEKPAVGVFDRRAVGPVGCDVAVAVQQVLPRDADVVEHDAAVVHAGQATLVVAVRGRHTG